MKLYVYGDRSRPMVARTVELAEAMGHTLVETPAEALVALAPLLRRKLSGEELDAPGIGTLIFHPSLLPRHRGPDAIRWTLHSGETYSGVTWFWANEGLDTGPVCEQEIVALDPVERPAELYERKMTPAGLRALRRALLDISVGHVRMAEQSEAAATYESWYPRPEPARAPAGTSA